MNPFSFVLALVGIACMFILRRDYKIAVFLASFMLFTLFSGGLLLQFAIAVFFVLSELPYYKTYVKKCWRSDVKYYILIVSLVVLSAVITSPHLHELSYLKEYVKDEVVLSKMMLIIAFVSLRRVVSIVPTLRVSLVSLIIMTVIGMMNYILKYSPVVSFFNPTEILEGYQFEVSQRFRVQSTFMNPFDYGFMCVLMSLLHLYAMRTRLENKVNFTIAQVCCLFGVMSCGCRTILLCYLIGLMVYMVSSKAKRSNRIKVVFLSVFAGITLFVLVPGVQKKVMEITSIFDTQATVNGSSLVMRAAQLGSVLYYIQERPVFGRGVYFFTADLGWGGGSFSDLVDKTLYGLEGIYLNRLLERGWLGLLLYFCEMGVLLYMVKRTKVLGRPLYSLGLSVFLVYFLFTFMTGELYSTPPTYCILGYVFSVGFLRRGLLEKRRQRCQE